MDDLYRCMYEVYQNYDHIHDDSFNTPEAFAKSYAKLPKEAIIRELVEMVAEYQKAILDLQQELEARRNTDFFVRDKHSGRIHRVGDDRHDSIFVTTEGELCYHHLQCGDGCHGNSLLNKESGFEFVPSTNGEIDVRPEGNPLFTVEIPEDGDPDFQAITEAYLLRKDPFAEIPKDEGLFFDGTRILENGRSSGDYPII